MSEINIPPLNLGYPAIIMPYRYPRVFHITPRIEQNKLKKYTYKKIYNVIYIKDRRSGNQKG